MRVVVVIQLFKYFWVSLLAAIIDYSLFVTLFEYLSIPYLIANTFAFCIGLVVNYTLSLKFVFKDEADKSSYEFIVFSIIGIVGLLISHFTLYITINRMNIAGEIAKIIAIGATFGWNFSIRKIILFNK